jgi:hypothetical protein
MIYDPTEDLYRRSNASAIFEWRNQVEAKHCTIEEGHLGIGGAYHLLTYEHEISSRIFGFLALGVYRKKSMSILIHRYQAVIPTLNAGMQLNAFTMITIRIPGTSGIAFTMLFTRASAQVTRAWNR